MDRAQLLPLHPLEVPPPVPGGVVWWGDKAGEILRSESLTPQASGKEGSVVFTERVIEQPCLSLKGRLISLPKSYIQLLTSPDPESVSVPSRPSSSLTSFS